MVRVVKVFPVPGSPVRIMMRALADNSTPARCWGERLIWRLVVKRSIQSLTLDKSTSREAVKCPNNRWARFNSVW